MEWNEDTIAHLRSLWAEGHSTAEIGRRIMFSKNAVVGKAHRLGLTARPSPIRRASMAAATPRPPLRRLTGPTLPPLEAEHAANQEPAPPACAAPPACPALVACADPLPAPASEAPRPPDPAPAPPVAVVPPARIAPPPRSPRHVACCWPLGEPGTKSFRFCDDTAVAGKPYCAVHAQLAYVKVRDRREDAAA